MRLSFQAIKQSVRNYFSRVSELYRETPPAQNEGFVGLTTRTVKDTPRMYFAPITALFTQNKKPNNTTLTQ